MSKEAKARIKINKLLEESGWRLLDSEKDKANVLLENNVTISEKAIDDLGEDFEKTKKGFIDFLLLDEKSFPIIVLEAKKEELNPLNGKEQARKYAKSQNCRFVILSNGNIHYFWDLEKGNPYVITKFPTPDSIKHFSTYKPNPKNLINEVVENDYIVITQNPLYKQDPRWINEATRKDFIKVNKLKFLRDYQIKAIKTVQEAVANGSDRFLWEMATGTGKTLTAGAAIKLFLRTGNAKRVLFLVDRLELEEQANKAFKNHLNNDYKSVIYKENKDDWRKAEIVVTTVQSLLFNNKYKKLFSPTDFDFIISDEAHRTIGGNSRAVFEYFIGYKLGLTATPKDYLKKIDPDKINQKDPREMERRLLLDTYKTFGCESGTPTFRYSLIDAVKDEFLVNPIVVDARTEITTQLLSDEGYSVPVVDEEGNEAEEIYGQRDFEKRFFSETTNRAICKAFLENAIPDPISGETGKTIMFCVSQNHALKITQILNEMASVMFPGKYNSDFALQVTSRITDAQQFTINFANNNLNGHTNFLPDYKTSKTRVCVTVGMMTTGYDCEDVLNVAMVRPIFSPTDFIQIKGRGTRKYTFEYLKENELNEKELVISEKANFKLFDFFANCEYFEEKYNYDVVLELPKEKQPKDIEVGPPVVNVDYENIDPDPLKSIKVSPIGFEGMKIDRMFFEKFEEKIKQDEFITKNVEEGRWDDVIDYVKTEVFDKPEEYFNLEKLRRSVKIDRRIGIREIIEKIFGFITDFKSKGELLDEEFEKFLSIYKPEGVDVVALKYYFDAYVTDSKTREIIDNKDFTSLNVNSTFNTKDFKAVENKFRELIPSYIKDYVTLNKFMN